MRFYCALALLGSLFLLGCRPTPPPMLGTLEWDRISVPAQSSEIILRAHVAEGDFVVADQLLLELDPKRLDARVAQADAAFVQAQAKLTELRNGARAEVIAAARASVSRIEADALAAELKFRRFSALYKKQQIAIADLDTARAQKDQTKAQVENAKAQLNELLNGTRPEQLAQAAAAMDAAQQVLTSIQLDRARLDVRAPREGHIDALPFKVGDQPPAGASVVSLLIGNSPYVRLFIPSAQRSLLAVGTRLNLKIVGQPNPFTGYIRSIAGHPTFTPYYALSGNDASHLMYRAEVTIEADNTQDLGAGLPVEASLIKP